MRCQGLIGRSKEKAQCAGLLDQTAPARIAPSTMKTSKITCVKESPVASCEAADMNTRPKITAKSATKPAKAADTSFPSLRTAHVTDGTTSRKIITAPMSSMVSIVERILILNHPQTQACS